MNLQTIFESYEREFCEYASSIKRTVRELSASAASVGDDGTTRRAATRKVESDVAECEALARRMDLEARSAMDVTAKTPMLNKLRDYKSELAKLKRDAREASAEARRRF